MLISSHEAASGKAQLSLLLHLLVSALQAADIPSTGVATETEGTPAVSWSFGSSCHQNGRSHMEDRVILVDLTSYDVFKGFQRAVLVAVFDGHGGASAAEYLAANITQQLVQQGAAVFLEKPLEALQHTLAELEQGLLAGWACDSGPASGSTACMALLLDSVLHVAHVGDSRAVLARGPKAVQLTNDHKPCCAAERERIMIADPTAILSEDGYLYGELGVSRGLGSAHIKTDAGKRGYVSTPDLSSITLEDTDDFIVLATDGLWDKVGSSDAVAAARRSLAATADPTAASQVLVERAQKFGSLDNISVITLVLHGRKIVLPTLNSRLFSRRALVASPAAPLATAEEPSVSAGTD